MAKFSYCSRKLERSVKHSVTQMMCFMEETALGETYNPAADVRAPVRLIIVRNEGESTTERMISESYLHGSPVLGDISGESIDPENQVLFVGERT